MAGHEADIAILRGGLAGGAPPCITKVLASLFAGGYLPAMLSGIDGQAVIEGAGA